MKKFLIYSLTIIISAFIPVYFLFLWEPLKSSEVINQNFLEEEILEKEIKTYAMDKESLSNGIFSNIENLSTEKKEKLNVLINNLSIIDIIKVSEYFVDLNNKENISNGLDLISKRMTEDKYSEFKEIIKEYIDLEN